MNWNVKKNIVFEENNYRTSIWVPKKHILNFLDPRFVALTFRSTPAARRDVWAPRGGNQRERTPGPLDLTERQRAFFSGMCPGFKVKRSLKNCLLINQRLQKKYLKIAQKTFSKIIISPLINTSHWLQATPNSQVPQFKNHLWALQRRQFKGLATRDFGQSRYTQSLSQWAKYIQISPSPKWKHVMKHITKPDTTML